MLRSEKIICFRSEGAIPWCECNVGLSLRLFWNWKDGNWVGRCCWVCQSACSAGSSYKPDASWASYRGMYQSVEARRIARVSDTDIWFRNNPAAYLRRPGDKTGTRRQDTRQLLPGCPLHTEQGRARRVPKCWHQRSCVLCHCCLCNWRKSAFCFWTKTAS